MMCTTRHDYARNINNASESDKTSLYKYILAKWQTMWAIFSQQLDGCKWRDCGEN